MVDLWTDGATGGGSGGGLGCGGSYQKPVDSIGAKAASRARLLALLVMEEGDCSDSDEAADGWNGDGIARKFAPAIIPGRKLLPAGANGVLWRSSEDMMTCQMTCVATCRPGCLSDLC